MTKKIKPAIAIFIALLVVLTFSTLRVHAAGQITTATYWKTLITSSSGFDRNVSVYNSSDSFDGLGILRADIQMLDSNDNVVWEEERSTPGNGTRVYWCGPDVYKIQIKVAYGSGVASAW